MKKGTELVGIVVIVGLLLASCGDSSSDDPSTPGHTHTPGTAATCTSEQTCTVCGTVIHAKLAHTPGAAVTCTVDQTCTVCNVIIIQASGHNFKWIVTNASYPAQSTEKCITCNIPSTSATRETQIGDIGPAGGIIYYINTSGFIVTGTGSFTAHYLEAALIYGATALSWASSSFTDTDIVGTGTAIGTGKENTRLILVTDANAPAANICANYGNGIAFDDWFLPSIDELYELYISRSHFGITSGWFWSSSQQSNNSVLVLRFSSGGQIGNSKDSSAGNIFTIRAF